ncbi:DUF4340 domain-containing protein [Paenibacillus psychroresistens]|uniref:DUF4340 domain-containing protein n=1 Tax=Paenibacillus psychroresistens TaxID=1778678 RepID=A0A6B8RDW1_9BACL|nr:DUF4340 domain-containing protein [Paenibacillus psychroresistens]QGQ93566.1 DUF4340 domain-containing protein [Paenibacillus psychroresistens]
MKRLLPTLILVIVCIGGFWYASSQNFFKDKTVVDEKKLFTLAAADIQAISFQAKNAASSESPDAVYDLTELTKKDAGWEMLKPTAYPINSFSVDSWNEAFAALTYEGIVEENATSLADYGLAEPKQFYQVSLKDGSTKKLLIGSPLPIEGHVYAKFADSPKIFDVTESLLEGLNKQPLDFVNKNAVMVAYDNVNSIQMDWKGSKWLLEKAQADKTVFESTWKLDGKDRKAEEGTALLDKVVALSTAELPKAAVEVKMEAPELKFTITESEAGKATISTFNGKIDKENVWIAKQGGAWAFSVPLASIQEAFDASKPAATPVPSIAPTVAP